MSRATETLRHPKRAIVEQYEKPIGASRDGKEQTVWMDRLECGHLTPSAYEEWAWDAANADNARAYRAPKSSVRNRHCKQCPKEQR